MSLALNEKAQNLVDKIVRDATALRVHVAQAPCGTRLIDCGATAIGGIEAGLRLAEVCLAGLGRVELQSSAAGQLVNVSTDQPIAACLAAQYAGWQVTGEKYFAMGSGPMRAAAGRETLFDDIGCRETATHSVGVLETHKLPPDAVCRSLAEACQVSQSNLTLLVARTASLAGTIQVVARSVETALHKLHELKFDLPAIVSGFGSVPLPPIAKDDLTAIGWTNDAVLYGGHVTLWVRTTDEIIDEIGPRVPSCASASFGEPFGVLFERAGRDFYKLDPLLFSPAVVTFINLTTGRRRTFGELRPDVLARSLGD